MKRYGVKEMFLTLQGEGRHAGRKSVFIRFAGCNLWNGRPEDRASGKGACSAWCDTDFVKGELKTAEEILGEARRLWPTPGMLGGWLVITGGEPLLQLDEDFMRLAQAHMWRVAVETNGTVAPNTGEFAIDWITVSPKLGAPLNIDWANEVKVVLPGGGEGWTDEKLDALKQQVKAKYWYVQPQDPILPSMVEVSHLKRGTIGTAQEFDTNVKRCIEVVMRDSQWRLSFQTHKVTGLR